MNHQLVERLRSLIAESTNIVVLGGVRVEEECGVNSVRLENAAYEVEQKYGYSPEEILTPGFLQNRVEFFYDYFKKYVIQSDKLIPGPAHEAVLRLEKEGKLSAVITRSPFGLYQMAGCSNVIELRGSIHKYRCMKCGKEYSDAYVMQAPGVPYCEECKIALRPDLVLYGEQLNNGITSRATEYVNKADTLLVAGSSMKTHLTKYIIRYYRGKKMILVNNRRCPNDDRADYVVYGRCDEILPMIIE